MSANRFVVMVLSIEHEGIFNFHLKDTKFNRIIIVRLKSRGDLRQMSHSDVSSFTSHLRERVALSVLSLNLIEFGIVTVWFHLTIELDRLSSLFVNGTWKRQHQRLYSQSWVDILFQISGSPPNGLKC